MKWTCVSSLGLVAVAYAAPATDDAAAASAPDGCTADHPDQFEVTVSPLMNKRSLQRRGCNDPTALLLTLQGGQLMDSQNRTGYIAANSQFQFDSPPQSDALATSGFSLCSNNTLALGSSTIFYQCDSGGFSNLYSQNDADQCGQINIVAMPCSGSGSSPAAPAVSQIADGQPQAPSSNGPPVSQIADGQPQAPSSTGQPGGPPVTQISDGQIQAPAPSNPASGPSGSGPPASGPSGSGPPGSGPSGSGPPASEVSSPDGTQPVSQVFAGAGEPPQNPAPPVPAGQAGSPPATNTSEGQVQASVPTQSSVAANGSITTPSTPAAPSQGGVSSNGFKTLPGATAALAIALFSIIAL